MRADWRLRAYCGLTSASLMTLLHTVVSSVRNLATSEGVLPTGSSCSSRSLASTDGWRIRSDMSRLIFSTIAGGVPWGAAAANQDTERNPGATVSAIVGVSGNTGRRLSAATAIILAFSDAMQRQRRNNRVEHHIDVARDQIVERRPCPPIRNVHHFDAGSRLEQLCRQKCRRADSLRRISQLLRICLCEGNQLRQRFSANFVLVTSRTLGTVANKEIAANVEGSKLTSA